MALWKDPAPTPSPNAAAAYGFTPAKTPAEAAPRSGFDRVAADTPAASPATVPGSGTANSAAAARPKDRPEPKETVIAAGLSIEGKINGAGHVRIAGQFKGDIQVEGNLHIDSGAKHLGEVRASAVTVGGELTGNITAKHIDVTASGVIVGDVKADTITVASGSRMRGHVEFGWGEGDGKKASLSS